MFVLVIFSSACVTLTVFALSPAPFLSKINQPFGNTADFGRPRSNLCKLDFVERFLVVSLNQCSMVIHCHKITNIQFNNLTAKDHLLQKSSSVRTSNVETCIIPSRDQVHRPSRFILSSNLIKFSTPVHSFYWSIFWSGFYEFLSSKCFSIQCDINYSTVLSIFLLHWDCSAWSNLKTPSYWITFLHSISTTCTAYQNTTWWQQIWKNFSVKLIMLLLRLLFPVCFSSSFTYSQDALIFPYHSSHAGLGTSGSFHVRMQLGTRLDCTNNSTGIISSSLFPWPRLNNFCSLGMRQAWPVHL